MEITEIKSKRGRPLGIKNKPKVLSVTVSKENYQSLLALQSCLSAQHGFPVTLEQTVMSALKSALE